MANPFPTSTFMDGAGRSRRVALMAALLAVACAAPAQAPVTPVTLQPTTQPPPPPAQPPPPPASPAPAQPTTAMEQLVGPIALYPDDLIAIILPAATNPLQIVQADRFLDKRKSDPKAPVDEKWDDSVKSLLNYPEVVKTMSKDLDWTSSLGEAVVADQAEVMAAIQSFRRKAQAVGNLKTDDKQVIVVEKEVIKIVPANPQVIYVPQYSPTTVVVYGGYYGWGYYPMPYPVYYYPYPPGAAFATGLIWGAAISATWHGGYACHYGGGATVIVRPPYHPPAGYRPPSGYRPPAGGGVPPHSGGRPGGPGGPTPTPWTSNKQPGQVSRSIGQTPSTRPGDSRPSGGGASRPTAQPSTGQVGGGSRNAGASARPSTGSGNALGGYGSGHSAQANSSRGASSRSSMSRSRPSSGGSRGGGGRR